MTKGNGSVVRAAIHPSIGIARVGNSEGAFFCGPEVVDPSPEQPGFYRQTQAGALKRQAARFRVYGYDTDGNVVAELNADNAEIDWRVHLANKKAAWYQFQLALDIPEAMSAPPSMLRNVSIGDRAKLAIDPGERQVTGRNTEGGAQHVFDTGCFMGKPVYLGEIRTDPKGRLIVLGGHGKSASHDGLRAVTFANNEGWHDDVADGPVTATVRFQGRSLDVDPAWIVVAPPNYAPLQKSVRTMWDLMRDVAIANLGLRAPERPSFNDDIRPIFERLSRLQWVNAGFAAAFGWRAPNHLADPSRLARLASKDAAERDLRQSIANEFRVFARDAWSPVAWPWLYGDAMNIPTPQTPRAFASLTDTQLKMLAQWASGDFVPDYDPAREPPRRIEDVPLAEQPAMLDRASLEFCLADAFHPGCEMTWVMRRPSLYMAPFRIRHAPPDWIEPQYGPQISPDMVSALPPFAGQPPGGITRWMALPWQTDTASCRSGYGRLYGPYLPTFWPARVPNQVLSLASYQTVMKTDIDLETRMAAFAQRADWLASIKKAGGYVEQINSYLADISRVSIIETRAGPKDDPNFPSLMEVEDLSRAEPALLAAAPAAMSEEVDLAGNQKVRRFPYGLKQLV
jgi:L-Lysine epsilon oxidase N-terminal/L-lysine epsilon oxidase C-terminal domain